MGGDTIGTRQRVATFEGGGQARLMDHGHAATAFATPLRLSAPGRRSALQTLGEAKRFVENELPAELAKLPRWTFASALVKHALASGKQRDLRAAERQLRQALSNEGWLAEAEG